MLTCQYRGSQTADFPVPPLPPTRLQWRGGGLPNVCRSSHIVSVTRICPASRLLLLPFLSPRLLFHLSSQVSKLLISCLSSFDSRSAPSRRTPTRAQYAPPCARVLACRCRFARQLKTKKQPKKEKKNNQFKSFF